MNDKDCFFFNDIDFTVVYLGEEIDAGKTAERIEEFGKRGQHIWEENPTCSDGPGGAAV